ncbi:MULTISPECIES: glutamate--cysteine ligase [Shewanella]|uniref:Glutamate--cysteine ligase n=1 Tax=Shewanella putrefaciens (strain 200) TaxID=399804 RepID=E6XMY7_SHEP2|nr:MULTISPECIES: glutamate--cysteine ligase [Shewanella]MCA1897162.1 glutamate--cysteine ligase [Shewanella putrefaciens]MCK7631267.1 glutamate--cysteine ligase [Shewanella sp. JNE9-1]MCK7635679.1 glutamate--cysteine ligase [Shewanella sp. JNE17]MCK7646520.1 glutamate--cysteine ligase [Shewanella sp. JNE3-1]MCK7650905.1 glutamate--cysteine ligase [Shewanella sp. JNE8]
MKDKPQNKGLTVTFVAIANHQSEKRKLKSFNELVEHFSDAHGRTALLGMLRGIEREALRIDEAGYLALDTHPLELGSALMHSRITTDYSEALLEFITPVNNKVEPLLEGLTETHAFSVRHLHGQRLWPVSMPCYVKDEHNIPVARYGSSNTGKMKTLYRKGLTYRYGALMQIISGVHFNFSVSQELWQSLYEISDKSLTFEDFISESYFGLIRNYRRLVWVLPYLFGASPALCSSFIKGQKTDLQFEKSGRGTLYLPYATSLRMSDLGYTNKEQEDLNISYNSLPEYLAGVNAAIKMPSANFANIGVKVDGEYRQLNANVLQIENEFYSPIRAKRVTRSGEKPSEALARAGVEYIEVRALDVNPFSPIGIEASQVRFLDLFLLYCLLTESPKSDIKEEARLSANLKSVVLEGRKPDLKLLTSTGTLSLKSWLETLFDTLQPLAKLLDGEASDYQTALAHWRRAVDDPNQTLSGQVIQHLIAKGQDHGQWVMKLAEQYHQYFIDYPLSAETIAQYQAEAKSSLEKQAELEAAQSAISFDDYLKDYFGAQF